MFYDNSLKLHIYEYNMYHIMKEFVTNKGCKELSKFYHTLLQNIDAKASNATDTNPANNLEAPERFLKQYERPPNPFVAFPAYKVIPAAQAVHPVAPVVVVLLQFKAAAPNP